MAKDMMRDKLAFAPVPLLRIRLTLAPEEWKAAIDSWLTLAEQAFILPMDLFSKQCKPGRSMSEFLKSYCRELAIQTPEDGSFTSEQARKLERLCFLITDRAVTADEADWIADPTFLSHFCKAFIRQSGPLTRFMDTLWSHKQSKLEAVLAKTKANLTKILESSSPESAITDLLSLAPLVHTSAQTGITFITGADFLDSLATAYSNLKHPSHHKTLAGFTYLCLSSSQNNISLLSESIYSLKAQADSTIGTPSLLADVATNTPLLTKLALISSNYSSERVRKLCEIVQHCRMPSIARRRRKGKNKAESVEMHIHRMSLVTQIQDLFPELGAGFVLKLLDIYGDNVEEATAHLLEDDLPSSLRGMDRSETAPVNDTVVRDEIQHLVPRPTPPPALPQMPVRRNVFDDDEILAADASRVYIGKRKDDSADLGQANKAAILSALAAIDPDDDERDDTYDAGDVGGTVEPTLAGGEVQTNQDEEDMILFGAYKCAPELFLRSSEARKSHIRMDLKRETNMTDEMIEGWAIMLQRDPRRLRQLEQRYSDRALNPFQPELARTAYQQDDSDSAGKEAQRGGRGRGRGGFRRGRGGRGGGNVAGPSDDASTAQAQRRKEANKGSRANHNRRDQRAWKMARGGLAG
ncbi:hypothetical protein K470DRAFT_15072 [Piedraia hortae CBS 480.64]|uniref:CUE domain-containing protein n=1 Tax=Piedraia hortae CBS 480.64 TaxID=1314780 RepID=A0A6A7C4E1_9PEZI|nr:hypothetical protein K470DRAFT_15072 [Piedraia hortae CBS 480.64]